MRVKKHTQNQSRRQIILLLLGWILWMSSDWRTTSALAGEAPRCALPGSSYQLLASGEWIGVWLGRDQRLAIFACAAAADGSERTMLVDRYIVGLNRDVATTDCMLLLNEYGDAERPYWEFVLVAAGEGRHGDGDFRFTVRPSDRPRPVHDEELSTDFVDNVPCRALPLPSNRHLPETHKY